MIAMASQSSWHPAFMPNSTADIITKGPSPPSNTPPVHKPIPQAVQPTPSPLPSDPEVQEVPSDTDTYAPKEDNDEHPELADLRDALTTSLASPGGVELDDNPTNDDAANRDIIYKEKADFPSEGPTPPNKHSSTMSFTRTVSEEVSWGEEDEVDSEWNIRRTDTDPFKFMPKSDRTNSFPQVPPAHSPATTFEPLHSEVEEIMNEVEREPRDFFGDDDSNGGVDFFSQGVHSNNDAQDVSEDLHEGVEASSFDQAVPLEEDQDSQARYEEGIPLVQSSEDSHTPVNGASLFLDDSEEEDTFFAQVRQPDASTEEQTSKPPQLERKSTSQVMDSLHFESHEQTHATVPEEDYISSSQSSLNKATGGGIAVSSSTVISQVVGDHASDLELDSGDGDLAEKWKAALAEDEFLDDDDDFLADDEPIDSKPLDPLAVFGSDDEGFLDDADDQSGSADFFSQSISPPIPAPVRNSSGQVIGFDSLSGSAHANVPRPGSSSNSRYVPAGTQSAALVSGNPYAPTAPVFTDLSRQVSSSATSTVPYAYGASMNSTLPNQQAEIQRPELHKAQSFADKSKGGYSSPYDLPMDVVKPRKPAISQPRSHSYNQQQAQIPVAPPRSSSMMVQQPPPSRGAASSLSPPMSSPTVQQSQSQTPSVPGATQPGPPTLKSKASFFEELPMSTRPKAAPRHSSGQSSYTATPPPSSTLPPPQARPQSSQGLVAPERVSPYASLPSNNMPPPAIASRYSPAPMHSQNQAIPLPPVAQSRYSPAPPSQIRQASYNSPPVASIPPMLPHQPRTSSPLAHFSHDSRSNPSAPLSNFDRRASSSYEPSLRPHTLPPTREVDENEESEGLAEAPAQIYPPIQADPAQFGMRQSQTPPPFQGFASRMGNSPPKSSPSSNYLPQQGISRSSASPAFSPPKRSQTQSPGTAYTGPRLETSNVEPYQRPASVETPISPQASISHSSMPVISTARPRGFSQGYNYVTPTDGREIDPMQRWRGAPVFVWGVGGSFISSFPKDVPRYGLNQTAPMVVRSPGEVKIRNIKELAPLTERLTSFPGPLKGKSKKKEVVVWLGSGITMLQQNASYLRTSLSLSHEDKRTEERILLWQILQIFIENDGILEGNAVVDKAVRSVLSPGLDDEVFGSAPLYATGSELSGISHSTTSATRSEPVDPAAVDQLRKHLLRGEREKAVWEAVDKRLWAHAMLISNTVSKDLYKQVAQEFVQKEVKNIGDNTESLAALYEIFAGNFEESVDELVPPSARAGFQMVSTSNSAGPSKDALDGLDRWRETLSLVLSNRSTDDSQALSALGKLLSGYGRAEAAHICFLFARTYSVFGGIDDPQASIVLVGSDHLRQPYNFDKELEPVLLSEVYEYGLSLSSTSSIAISSPHLAIYKIQHALTLAEYGYREKALQYCEAIAASITSQTRRSPYHHGLLVSELDDLSKRLKQSPKDEKSSWISKPSIDKVSGSVWSKFNKFVAGEENDNGVPGSNTESGSEVGPFARIAGGTPTISRSPSASDLYGSYNGGIGTNGTLAQSSVAGSRYAPGGSYTPPTDQGSFQPGSYGSQGRGSFEGRRSGEHRRGPYDPIRRDSDYRPDSQPAPNTYLSQAPAFTPQTSSYSPYGNDSPHSEPGLPYGTPSAGVNNSQPASSIYSSPPPLNTSDGYQPSPYEALRPSFEPQQSLGYNEPSSSSGYEPPNNSSYEPPQNTSYEPPSGGYEPPSYEPTTMNEEPDSPIDTRPKKKSFMDDDYDDGNTPAVKQATESREKSKAEKDREAQEAFRKAAEADAARPKEAAPAKKSWGLGGWFGGAKKESTDTSASPNKPIRAKLGEESSFVYDPELKRWINKKGGADNTPTPTATPPPPRATGPPRSVSGAAPPGPTSAPRMGASSRVSSASSDAPFPGSNAPPASAPPAMGSLAAPPAMNRTVSNSSIGPGSGPPSRPGTSMSNASSIDDLLGPALPGGRKGTAKMKKKGRGYIDVMGEKAPGS